jgi:lipid-A-disaccharide synthase
MIREINRLLPGAQFTGIAGPHMKEQGCTSLYSMDELTVLGIFEAVGKVSKILWIRRKLLRHLLENPPDVFVGIDAPDFNLPLEQKLREHGIPCVHYVSPTVWAWRQYRLKKIKKAVSHMLTLLPFEAKFYQERDIPVTFVGHPMAEEIDMHPDMAGARDRLGLPQEKVIVALLPGSRKSELERHAGLFVETAKWIYKRNSKLHFVAAPVNESTREQFEIALVERNGTSLPLTIITGRARDIMTASDVVVLASGTAALEAALLKKPMVVTYKISFATYWMVKMLSHVKYYSMPNNLAGRQLVPELMQFDATPEKIGKEVEKYLAHPELMDQLSMELEKIHQELKQDGDRKAAEAVLAIAGVKRRG